MEEQIIKAKLEELKELLDILRQQTAISTIIENRISVYEDMLESEKEEVLEYVLDSSVEPNGFLGRLSWLKKKLDVLMAEGKIDSYQIFDALGQKVVKVYSGEEAKEEIDKYVNWVNKPPKRKQSL